MSDRAAVPEVIKCCICTTESSTVQELEDHISTWHINLCDRFQCEQCLTQQKQAKFSTEVNLKSHMEQEHGIRQFWFRTWSSPETNENSAKIRQLVEQSLDCSRSEIPPLDQSQPMDEIVPETQPSSPRSTHNPRDNLVDPCLTVSNAKIEVELNVNEMDTKDGITDRSVRSRDDFIPVICISDSDSGEEEYIRDQQVCATRSKESPEPESEFTISQRDQETNQTNLQTVHIPKQMAKKSVNAKMAHSMIHRIRTARSVLSRDTNKKKKRHIPTRTGERRFKCKHCDFAGISPSALKIHNRIHTGEKRYKCNQCDYTSDRSGHLRTHIGSHKNGEKTHKCNQCYKSFANSRYLNGHKKRCHV